MCGVIGIYGSEDVFEDLYQGMLAIQHRGQDSAGIMTYDGRFHTKKGNGLVNDIFNKENVRRLKGHVGIGHTRYPTIGGGRGEDAQPFFVNSPFGIIMAHNGNVINYPELKKELFEKYRRILNSDNDVEVILNIFANELEKQTTKVIKPEHVFKAAQGVFEKVKGSYSVVAYIAEQGMVAFRDPFGIKPLVYGEQRHGLFHNYAFASESVSLNLTDFSNVKDVKPGQVVYVDNKGKLYSKSFPTSHHAPCLFEWVYFARPDSIIDGVNVYKCRINLGRLLAEEIKKLDLKIDVVIPVPDSARDAAIEISRKLNIRYREALIKNRYIGRTFIMPSDKCRKDSIKQKLNPIVSEFKNKNVLIVDDSIVRGHTSRSIIEMARACGAKKVYFASYSPPLRYPCVYGIDMQTHTEFVARDLSQEQVARKIKADRVIYQPIESLKKAVHMENESLTEFCGACFDGNYPTGDVTPDVLAQIEKERTDVRKRQMELTI